MSTAVRGRGLWRPQKRRHAVVMLALAGGVASLFGTAGFARAQAYALPKGRLPVTTDAQRALLDARVPASDHALYLSAGIVATDQACLPIATVAADAGEAGKRRVIQLDGPMTPEREAALRAAGVELGEYLPVNAFVARFDHADAKALAKIDFVRWHAVYDPAWKVDPRLGQRSYGTDERRELAGDGKVAVTVSLFRGEDAAAVADRITAQHGAVVRRVEASGDGTQRLVAVLGVDDAARLADEEAVQFVEELPEATPRNDTDRWVVQSNVANVTPVYAQGLHGEGQVLGFIDGPPNIAHCSFADTVPVGAAHRKVLAYNGTFGTDAHGTHTACTAVGDAGAFDDTRGVAFKAKLVYSPVPGLVDGALNTKLVLHHAQGARVHTNSWGADNRSDYNVWCRDTDTFCFNNEDDLVLFAVSNLNTIFTPENAKNCLAVAASQDAPNQDFWGIGGHGPTSDLRRKPEIMAPGVGIFSADTQTTCGVRAFTGTSMATPAVAATAMLVRQYYSAGFYPTGAATPANAFTPTGALLKATLLNSAQDMTGVTGYPSDTEGWGRVLADRALHFAGDTRTLAVWDIRKADPRALTTGGVNEHRVTVNSNEESLRITLVFMDAPAALNALYAPVNDLNLEVTSPDGHIFRGNVFAGGASAPDTPFGGAGSQILFDARNNVEQVLVTSPVVGQWTVRIKAPTVNVGPQAYAVVASGDVAAVGPCVNDVTGDGQVNSTDLAFLLSVWGPGGGPADITGDGQVNSADLARLLGGWGPCP